MLEWFKGPLNLASMMQRNAVRLIACMSDCSWMHLVNMIFEHDCLPFYSIKFPIYRLDDFESTCICKCIPIVTTINKLRVWVCLPSPAYFMFILGGFLVQIWKFFYPERGADAGRAVGAGVAGRGRHSQGARRQGGCDVRGWRGGVNWTPVSRIALSLSVVVFLSTPPRCVHVTGIFIFQMFLSIQYL